MAFYEEFKKSLIPGNYALTKSMELNKVQSSGTLWYTKKFIVFYYFIFLTDDIFNNEYIDKIISIFDNYIDALDESIKSDAKEFFFPCNDAINLKNERFLKFSQFASFNDFENSAEREEYLQRARRCYFSLMMGSGGQAGVKKYLKEAIEKPSFIYSKLNIQLELDKAAAKSLADCVNRDHRVTDNSIKYLVSDVAIRKVILLSNTKIVTENDVQKIMRDYRMDNPQYINIENDMVAFIRNERQILYYYGFFHSKSNGGARNMEFSSLTPVGHLAVQANADEMLLLWEHQKLKMISQPATAEINNINTNPNDSTLFHISFSPYLDILSYIIRNEKLSLDEYQYIVSRKKHIFKEEDWNCNETDIVDHIDDIKAKVESFNRVRDIKTEDSAKELKKYLLGLLSNLQYDNNTNKLGVLSLKNNKVSITNNSVLNKIISIYKVIDSYKIDKFKTLFVRCERDLQRRYRDTALGNNSNIDSKVKIDWDLYNIRPDKFIIFSVMYLIGSVYLGVPETKMFSKDTLESLVDFCFIKFKYILCSYTIKSKNKLKNIMKLIATALENFSYDTFLNDENKKNFDIFSEYMEQSSADLLNRLESVSRLCSVSEGERVRNTFLVKLLKSYDMKVFSVNNMLPCECCGKETFITQSDEPYIEYHHLIPFNIANGPDHYLNLFALCPSCHRKIHFQKIELKSETYNKLNINNYLHKSFEDRLKELKREKVLCSYHLEFLLAEKAIDEDTYNRVAS